MSPDQIPNQPAQSEFKLFHLSREEVGLLVWHERNFADHTDSDSAKEAERVIWAKLAVRHGFIASTVRFKNWIMASPPAPSANPKNLFGSVTGLAFEAMPSFDHEVPAALDEYLLLHHGDGPFTRDDMARCWNASRAHYLEASQLSAETIDSVEVMGSLANEAVDLITQLKNWHDAQAARGSVLNFHQTISERIDAMMGRYAKAFAASTGQSK